MLDASQHAGGFDRLFPQILGNQLRYTLAQDKFEGSAEVYIRTLDKGDIFRKYPSI